MRHCVVTPEIAFDVGTSGVATNATHLARFLARVAGRETVLLCLAPRGEGLEALRERVRSECGAELICEEDLPSPAGIEKLHPGQLRMSHRCMLWLLEHPCDVIHSMQYQAVGFSVVQAKRLGSGFRNSHLVNVLNSPRIWVEEGNHRAPTGRPNDLIVEHMEQYAAEHSDGVVCPSRELLRWVREIGWALPDDTRWLPTWTPWKKGVAQPAIDPGHLVFLARLETRKGLDIFTNAISRFCESPPEGCRQLRVSIVGKPGVVFGVPSETLISHWAESLPEWVTLDVHTTLTQAGAMEFIEAHPRAVFIYPTRLDSYPNAVLEAVVRGLNVLCSDDPGTAEMLDGRAAVFPGSEQGLDAKLREVWREGLPEVRLACPMEKAEQLRLDFVAGIERLPRRTETVIDWVRPRSRISVCLPYYNMGRYLPACLEALHRQAYSGKIELIVVDDGSSDAESIAVFDAMEARYGAQRNWRFLRKPNEGISATRNYAAAAAEGELLAFVDADNIPHPHMLDTLERRLHHARLDCVTCYLYMFEEGASPDPRDLRLLAGFPGGCLEAAIFHNTLGDANMLVRREAFEAVGGFHRSRQDGSEDRAFLIRLVRRGFRLDCTPEMLFSYCLRPGSFSRNADPYLRHLAVFEAFTEGMDPWLRRLLRNQFGAPDGRRAASTGATGLLPEWASEKIEELRGKHWAERDKRRERDRKADERYASLLRWRYNRYVRFGRFLGVVPRDF